MQCCLNLRYGVFHFLVIYLYDVDRFIAKCSVPENVLLCNFIYLEMHVLPLSTRRVDNHIELTSTLTEFFYGKSAKKNTPYICRIPAHIKQSGKKSYSVPKAAGQRYALLVVAK